jgi:WD40 repeat protein
MRLRISFNIFLAINNIMRLRISFNIFLAIVLLSAAIFSLNFAKMIEKSQQKLLPHEEQVAEQPPPEGKKEIETIFTNSKYKTISKVPEGKNFRSGQPADIVLNWFGFNDSGGPLVFNHPMGMASDGKRLLLADTRNNRILIWNTLPTGNQPPDLVLGQKDFHTCTPGSSRDKLRWPVDVSIGNGKIAVADTFNGRILLWNDLPTNNGEPADVVIEGIFSWGVWTNGEKLLATSTWHKLPAVYIWNKFPNEDNQQPDLIFSIKEFGTPRDIITDGSTYLIVGDHNAKVYGENGPGTGGIFIWHTFPNKSDQKYDAFIDGFYWNLAVIGDDLYAADSMGNIAVFKNFRKLKGIISVDPMNPPEGVILFRKISFAGIRGFTAEGGDGSSTVYVKERNITYMTLYNGGRIVGYFGKPEDRIPDFVIGSNDPMVNPLSEKYYFYDNPAPISNGKSLIVLAGYGKAILVWKNIPDESGAIPDIVYKLSFEPVRGTIWDDKLYIIGRGGAHGGFIVWKMEDLLNGREPEVFEKGSVGGVDIGEGWDIDIDEKYVYLVANGKLYIYKQPFNINSKPIKELKIDGVTTIKAVSSNGKKLAVLADDRDEIYIFDINTLLSENPGYIVIREVSGYHIHPNDVFIGKDKLFIVDGHHNSVLIWNEISERSDEPPDAVIGKEGMPSKDLKPEDIIPEYTRNGLFWPDAVWYDGSFLWVGEFKFSGRVLRYSPHT